MSTMSSKSLLSISSHFGIDMPFRDVYQVTEKLGKGAFGSVWKTEHKVSGEEFAVKIIDRRWVCCERREARGVFPCCLVEVESIELSSYV